MYDKLFLALMGASAAHAEASRAEFARLGLSAGQPKVLYILRRTEGIVQKELAALCGVKEPTLTALLKKMEREDLVRRERSSAEGCRTAIRVFFTVRGRAVADALEEAVERLERVGFAQFSEENRKTLLEMLCQVTENIRQHRNNGGEKS